MRKLTPIIAAILLFVGCTDGLAVAEDTSTTTTESTTTTTFPPEPAQITPKALLCVSIGSPANDPTIYNLEWVGHDLNYEPIPGEQTGGLWYMDSTIIGAAEQEDEPFAACGPTDSPEINKIIEFQNDAITAGAEPFPEE